VSKVDATAHRTAAGDGFLRCLFIYNHAHYYRAHFFQLSTFSSGAPGRGINISLTPTCFLYGLALYQSDAKVEFDAIALCLIIGIETGGQVRAAAARENVVNHQVTRVS
jgi:hypothetical protein